VLRG